MFDLIEIEFGDQTLHGLTSSGSRDNPAVIHLHGTGGNFYSNAVIAELGTAYAQHGFSYATVNLPGYDAFARSERFTASRGAINAWVQALGFENAILQGHSLGALKALDLCLTDSAEFSVDRLILLSPFDILAFYAGGNPDNLAEIRTTIEKDIAESGPDASIRPTIFDMWDMSNATFLELTEAENPADRFPSRNPKLIAEGHWLPEMTTFLGIGGEDFASHPSPGDVFNMLPNKSNLTAHLIEGAAHNFDGGLSTLRSKVLEWLL